MLKKYTVVGFNEAEGTSITDFIDAPGADEAMLLFAEDRAFPEGTVIIDVFQGHHKSVMPISRMNATVYCSDLKNER